MAKKLPIVPVAIAAGAGVATYFAATQLTQRVAFMQQHPMAVPAALAAVGVLVAKKHVPVGIGIAGAAGAIGYLQYKAGAQATAQPSQVQQQTQPAAYTPPAQQTQPSQPAQQPTTATPSGGGTDAFGNALSQATNAIAQSGDQGTAPGAAQSADGSTQTQGWGGAGKLLSGPRPHSHLATWRRQAVGLALNPNQQNAGALLSGPRPSSHLAPWHRNAGHYDRPGVGEAGSFDGRGGAFGLTSD